jgi:hypothetical protein
LFLDKLPDIPVDLSKKKDNSTKEQSPLQPPDAIEVRYKNFCHLFKNKFF